MIDTIRKYLDMPFVVTFALIIICVTAWSAVFYFSINAYAILIPLEFISLYTLILTLYWLRLFIISSQFQEELEVWEVIQKKSVTLALSMELNIIFSIYYLYSGIVNHSRWFLFVAFFYISLTIARFIMLRQFCMEIHTFRSQVKRYIAAGCLMLVMMICLCFMTLMAVSTDYVVHYPRKTIYIQTVFSIYLITSAISGYRKYKKYRSPLLSGNQMVSISAALLGILSLQTAYLPMISHHADDIHKANIFTGIVIFSIMICMSLYMIIHGKRTLARSTGEESSFDEF